MDCPGLLGNFKDRRCYEEAIRELPESVRSVLADALSVLSVVLGVDILIATQLRKYYLFVISTLDAEIALLKKQNKPIMDLLNTLQTWYYKYSDCPGIATLIKILQQEQNKIENKLDELVFRRNTLARSCKTGGVSNLDAITLRFLGVSPILEQLREFLDGTADCLHNLPGQE